MSLIGAVMRWAIPLSFLWYPNGSRLHPSRAKSSIFVFGTPTNLLGSNCVRWSENPDHGESLTMHRAVRAARAGDQTDGGTTLVTARRVECG